MPGQPARQGGWGRCREDAAAVAAVAAVAAAGPRGTGPCSPRCCSSTAAAAAVGGFVVGSSRRSLRRRGRGWRRRRSREATAPARPSGGRGPWGRWPPRCGRSDQQRQRRTRCTVDRLRKKHEIIANRYSQVNFPSLPVAPAPFPPCENVAMGFPCDSLLLWCALLPPAPVPAFPCPPPPPPPPPPHLPGCMKHAHPQHEQHSLTSSPSPSSPANMASPSSSSQQSTRLSLEARAEEESPLPSPRLPPLP